MAWDDLTDMWWMQRPPKSDLPQIATQAFLGGLQAAQRRAEFEAELPMKVAQSQAQTAATIAQSTIATDAAKRAQLDWQQQQDQAPWVLDYSKKVTDWMSVPNNTAPLPPIPDGLTGKNLGVVMEMQTKAAEQRNLQDAKGLINQVQVNRVKKIADLVSAGKILPEDVNNPEKVKQGFALEAKDVWATLGEKYRIPNIDSINPPLNPDGSLNTTLADAMLKRMAPSPSAPAGMEIASIKYDDKGNPAYEYKQKNFDLNKIQEEGFNKFLDEGQKAGKSPIQIMQEWNDIQTMRKEGVPIEGSPKNPMPSSKFNKDTMQPGTYAIKIDKEMKDDNGQVVPVGTVIKVTIPQKQSSIPLEDTSRTVVTAAGAYKFSGQQPATISGLIEAKKQEYNKEVSKLKDMGVSAPTTKQAPIYSTASVMNPFNMGSRTVATTQSEKTAYDKKVREQIDKVEQLGKQLDDLLKQNPSAIPEVVK